MFYPTTVHSVQCFDCTLGLLGLLKKDSGRHCINARSPLRIGQRVVRRTRAAAERRTADQSRIQLGHSQNGGRIGTSQSARRGLVAGPTPPRNIPRLEPLPVLTPRHVAPQHAVEVILVAVKEGNELGQLDSVGV